MTIHKHLQTTKPIFPFILKIFPIVYSQQLRTKRTAGSEADIANDCNPGVAGEAFTFSRCCNMVTVGEGSGLVGEVSQIQEFISNHLKP